jgi:hypothetical protein
MSSKTEYDHAIALCESWLSTCFEKHISCSTKAQHTNIFGSDNFHYITDFDGSGLVRSRLLHLPTNAPSDENDQVVELVPASELEEHTEYVALSNRWGLPSTMHLGSQLGAPCKRRYPLQRFAADVSRCHRRYRGHGIRVPVD